MNGNDNKPAAAQEAVWELAKKVRTELDRASCPDAFMRLAVEAVMEHAAAPVAAAPVDLHAHLLHMLGAKDHEDAGRIIGELHAASMSTPAAPGIEVESTAAPPSFIMDDGACWRHNGKAYIVTIEDGKMRFSIVNGAHIEYIGEAQPYAAIPTALPGIDVEPLIAIRNQLHQMSAAKDLGEGWSDVVIEMMGDVQKLIDASPKGGSDERARFEAWAINVGLGVTRKACGRYSWPSVQTSWVAWQAAMQPTSHGAGVSDGD